MVYLSFAVIAKESSASACWLPTNETFKVQPTDLNVREGDNATFTCISSHSNASTSIDWITKPNIYNKTIVSVFDRNSSNLNSTLTIINVGEKIQTIQCYIQVGDSEGTNSHACYSRVSNLIVHYAPRVAIIPAHVDVLFDHHEAILFKCNVDSNPQVASVNWICLPDDIFDGCGTSSKDLALFIRQDVITKRSHNYVSASVLCLARNSVDYSNSLSSITLARPGYSEGNSPSDEKLLAIVLGLVVYVAYYYAQVCLLL